MLYTACPEDKHCTGCMLSLLWPPTLHVLISNIPYVITTTCLAGISLLKPLNCAIYMYSCIMLMFHFGLSQSRSSCCSLCVVCGSELIAGLLEHFLATASDIFVVLSTIGWKLLFNLMLCVWLPLDMLGHGTLSRRLKSIRKDIRRHVVQNCLQIARIHAYIHVL